MTETEKTPEEILFPEAKVGDTIIKPWSFGKLFDVSVALEKILDKAEKKKIDLNDLDSIFEYATMAKLFTLASKELLDVIALTLDKKVAEVKALSMEEGLAITIIIAKQNWATIKNVLNPLLPQEEEVELLENETNQETTQE